MKWLFYLAGAVCLLLLVTVFLNNMRWWYFREGTHVLDKWTGQEYHVSDETRPAPFADTAMCVFEVAGGVGLTVGIVVSLVKMEESRRNRSKQVR